MVKMFFNINEMMKYKLIFNDAYELLYSYDVRNDCAFHLVKWKPKWSIVVMYEVICILHDFYD